MKQVCIVGASGKLGQYMVEHALARGYQVNAACRAKSVDKLSRFGDRIAMFPGATNDQQVIARAASGCDGVLTVLMPWGVHDYSSGTARAVLDNAEREKLDRLAAQGRGIVAAMAALLGGEGAVAKAAGILARIEEEREKIDAAEARLVYRGAQALEI